MKKTAAVVIIGSMSVALVACGPSPEFEKNCKNAGGEVKRESEVSSIFGMAPIAFEVVNPPRPPAPKPVIKIPKDTKPVQKAPKVNSPTLAPKAPPINSDTNVQMPAAAGSGKGKSKKSSDDDDWVCVKNGEVIFEED